MVGLLSARDRSPCVQQAHSSQDRQIADRAYVIDQPRPGQTPSAGFAVLRAPGRQVPAITHRGARRAAEPGRNLRRIAVPAALLAVGVVGGAVLAGTVSASAADSTSPSTTPTYGGMTPGGPGPGMAGGSSPVRGDETSLSSADEATASAAAKKAVPGATVIRAETDAGDGVYEVHMTKSDGSLVTVKLDRSFKVTAVEDGRGLGDPAPPGQTGPGPTGSGTAGSGA
jgi:hypothetical protein